MDIKKDITLRQYQESFPNSPYSYLEYSGDLMIRKDNNMYLHDSASVNNIVFYHWLEWGNEVTFFNQTNNNTGILCSRLNIYKNWYLYATGSDLRLVQIDNNGEILDGFSLGDSVILSVHHCLILKKCCNSNHIKDSRCMLCVRYLLAKRLKFHFSKTFKKENKIKCDVI